LRNGLRQVDARQTASDITLMKQLLGELETLLKVSGTN
jgi:hypothetical protein